MAYEQIGYERPHQITLEGRKKLVITGVREVESFNESCIILRTESGGLVVDGQELHIEKLSLDGGDVIVEGLVDAISYEDTPQKRGFFSRR